MQRYRNVEEKIKKRPGVMEWRTTGGWKETVVGSGGRGHITTQPNQEKKGKASWRI